jgi:hypothetical protein
MISYEFGSNEEMMAWLAGKPAPKAVAPEVEEPVAPKAVAPEVEEPVAPKAVAPEVEEPVAPKKAKVKAAPVVETLNPEKPSDKDREKARTIAIGQIRGFVVADKVNNMKKLIAVMPEGKKALDALTLEEAQAIVLELGIE